MGERALATVLVQLMRGVLFERTGKVDCEYAGSNEREELNNDISLGNEDSLVATVDVWEGLQEDCQKQPRQASSRPGSAPERRDLVQERWGSGDVESRS